MTRGIEMGNEQFADKFRNSVVGVEQEVPLITGGYCKGINFDNAATTPPFYSVMREVNAFSNWYSSVHRGTGYKSLVSSKLYDDGRARIKRFVGADREEDLLIYTKNTTESINLLADIFYQEHSDAVILSTQMEHLANDLPWRTKFFVDYVKVDKSGRLDMDHLKCLLEKYQGRVKLVTLTGASNVTGFMNPIHAAAELTHSYGAEIMVDGAQLVPHCRMDMKSHSSIGHIDYLAFSAHKMYAPFGVGVLIGPKRSFGRHTPYIKGGGAVKLVTQSSVDWDDPPYRDEAGTPNVIGVSALLKAIECLKRLGMERIHQHEQNLCAYITEGLAEIEGSRVYGQAAHGEEKVSLVSFSLPGIQHRMLATILSYEYGIAVRSGLFCAHPYVQELMGLKKEDIQYYQKHSDLPFPGLVRVSLGLYNNGAEAQRFIRCVKEVAANKAELLKKYQAVLSVKSAPKQNSIFYKQKRELP